MSFIPTSKLGAFALLLLAVIIISIVLYQTNGNDETFLYMAGGAAGLELILGLLFIYNKMSGRKSLMSKSSSSSGSTATSSENSEIIPHRRTSRKTA